MILVDTSVWITHLRRAEPELVTLLRTDKILIHAMIIGELACGPFKARARRLGDWRALLRITELSHAQVVSVIESRNLMGRVIGFVDAHLLCAVLNRNGTTLWTRDGKLQELVEKLGVVFSESV